MFPTEFGSYDMDTVVLSETKKKGKVEEELGNYIHIWSGVTNNERAMAGVSIILSNH